MLGAVVIRLLIMVLGYMYPAYGCYKAVELKKPDLETLRYWCQYWVIIAVVTVAERVLDVFVSWFPMYNEAKLAFMVYLWHPKTRGTAYIFSTFVRPFVSEHEAQIDQHLDNFQSKAGAMAIGWWNQGCAYAHDCFVDLLTYAASQAPQAGQRGLQQRRQGYNTPHRRMIVQEEEEEFEYDVVEDISPADYPEPAEFVTKVRQRSTRMY
eukprot:SM000030S11447  [mRNA]  locus=s30:712694:714343:- [translate_table: standard]